MKQYLLKRSDYDQTTDYYINIINTLELNNIINSKIITLSGGELQRLVCASILLKKADVLIGNSSAGIIEAPYIQLPVVNIGNRQIDRLSTFNVNYTGYDNKEII